MPDAFHPCLELVCYPPPLIPEYSVYSLSTIILREVHGEESTPRIKGLPKNNMK